MRPSLQRLLAVSVLACWMAPSAAALAVGLHVVLEHHGHHGVAESHHASDPARAPADEHHHDTAAAPGHEHEVIVGGTTAVTRSSTDLVATSPALDVSGVFLVDRTRPDGLSRHGPPIPLFTVNCSLLL